MRPIPLFLDPDPDPELAVNRCVLATGTHLATLETVLLTDCLVEVVLQPRHQQLAGLPLHREPVADPVPSQAPLLVRHDQRRVQMGGALVLMQGAMGQSRPRTRPIDQPFHAVLRPGPHPLRRPGRLLLAVVAGRAGEDPGLPAPIGLPPPSLLPPALLACRPEPLPRASSPPFGRSARPPRPAEHHRLERHLLAALIELSRGGGARAWSRRRCAFRAHHQRPPHAPSERPGHPQAPESTSIFAGVKRGTHYPIHKSNRPAPAAPGERPSADKDPVAVLGSLGGCQPRWRPRARGRSPASVSCRAMVSESNMNSPVARIGRRSWQAAVVVAGAGRRRGRCAASASWVGHWNLLLEPLGSSQALVAPLLLTVGRGGSGG